jgi:CDP-diacylglycerol--glycerol-3-phosphate 3-phosphatidyltransferase
VFALAAITDQVDGFLARRWHVESAFGKVADPLADRVMIGVAAVLLGADGRIPWLAVVIVVGRDLLLVVGYRLVVPHGYTFEVSELGKAATWVLYLGVTCAIVTDASAAWPEWVAWLGIGLALVAAAQYVLKARREMNPSRERHDRRE